MPLFKEGDSVRFKKPGDKHLSPSVVKGKNESPRSYFISDETGRDYYGNSAIFILLKNYLLL